MAIATGFGYSPRKESMDNITAPTIILSFKNRYNKKLRNN